MGVLNSLNSFTRTSAERVSGGEGGGKSAGKIIMSANGYAGEAPVIRIATLKSSGESDKR